MNQPAHRGCTLLKNNKIQSYSFDNSRKQRSVVQLEATVSVHQSLISNELTDLSHLSLSNIICFKINV